VNRLCGSHGENIKTASAITSARARLDLAKTEHGISTSNAGHSHENSLHHHIQKSVFRGGRPTRTDIVSDRLCIWRNTGAGSDLLTH